MRKQMLGKTITTMHFTQGLGDGQISRARDASSISPRLKELVKNGLRLRPDPGHELPSPSHQRCDG